MSLRIAYFGLPLGALLLRSDGHELVFAALSPVEAPGERRLRRWLGERVIRAPDRRENVHFERAIEDALERTKPALLVSWFWTRKLPARWLAVPTLGGIGVHPSLLPRHRGPNPYFWAIDAGDTDTGVSVHRLEAEYDTGAILHQERLAVGNRNAWQLARALDRPSLAGLRYVVKLLDEGRALDPIEQKPELASFAPEPSDTELSADFRWPTARVLRRIRALSPVPGLALTLAQVSFFVTEAEPFTHFVASLEPREAQLSGERLVLRTSDGAISVERAQLVEPSSELGAREVSGAELTHLLAARLAAERGNSFKEEAG